MATATTIDAAAYRALTEDAALVDRSERGKLAIAGPQAREFLDGQVTNAIAGLADGHGCYAALLTNKGKMLADLRVLAVGAPHEELWLDCERVALQSLFDVLRRALIGWSAELRKRTLEKAILSLIGPRARAIVDAEDLVSEHDNRVATIGGVAVVLAATDLGVDVICDAGDAGTVRTSLAVREVDEGSAEVVRVESGRPRYGLELDDSVIPQEAGLNERAVSFQKGCYVGQETVARLYYKGKPNRHLRGLRLSAPVATGTPLLDDERELGRVATSVVSPRLGPIALALVRREAQVGDELATPDGVRATVVELPFADD